MNTEQLIRNILDQVKEAQLKLGYERETIRLYYQLSSINALLGTSAKNLDEIMEILLAACEAAGVYSSDNNITLDRFQIDISRGRIEVCVPPDICEYVDKFVPASEFLKDFIKLMTEKHNIHIDDMCRVFEKHDKNYIRKDMPANSDFDYVLYFSDKSVDEYFYCIKDEGIHCIYHRFIEADYLALLV